MQLVPCSVLRGWTGMMQGESRHLSVSAYYTDPIHSVKAGLRAGRIPADGDSWPKFLYVDGKHEKGRSWKGLFRSQLLVNVIDVVSVIFAFTVCLRSFTTGLPVYIYMPQLSRERRFQSHAFWKCQAPWYDFRQYTLTCICCYSGMSICLNSLSAYLIFLAGPILSHFCTGLCSLGHGDRLGKVLS